MGMVTVGRIVPTPAGRPMTFAAQQQCQPVRSSNRVETVSCRVGDRRPQFQTDRVAQRREIGSQIVAFRDFDAQGGPHRNPQYAA